MHNKETYTRVYTRICARINIRVLKYARIIRVYVVRIYLSCTVKVQFVGICNDPSQA